MIFFECLLWLHKLRMASSIILLPMILSSIQHRPTKVEHLIFLSSDVKIQHKKSFQNQSCKSEIERQNGLILTVFLYAIVLHCRFWKYCIDKEAPIWYTFTPIHVHLPILSITFSRSSTVSSLYHLQFQSTQLMTPPLTLSKSSVVVVTNFCTLVYYAGSQKREHHNAACYR